MKVFAENRLKSRKRVAFQPSLDGKIRKPMYEIDDYRLLDELSNFVNSEAIDPVYSTSGKRLFRMVIMY